MLAPPSPAWQNPLHRSVPQRVSDPVPTASLPFLPGLAPLAPRYDGFILDLWGVIHDGKQVFPHAVETLRALRAAGKRVVLLSNAPRREHVVAARNRTIGLPDGLVDGIVTSGEEAWRHMHDRPDAFHQALGHRCLHIGDARDLSMREGQPDYVFVEDAESADCILNTGSTSDPATEAGIEAQLAVAARRDLPMVCANPDRVVISGGRREPCAGAIADRYEALGGRVAWHGKPFPGVYARAVEALGVSERNRVLCVGDGMETDMTGARNAGLEALFILGGIHHYEVPHGADGTPDPDALAALAARYRVAPVAVLPRFVW